MSPRTAYVALGANLGQASDTLLRSLPDLCTLADDARLEVSRLYVSTPFEVREAQPNYFNAVVGFQSSRLAIELLRSLHAIEHQFGRERTAWHAARTLDLDLLMVGDEVCNGGALTLPHPGIASRSFVLCPLLDIAPEVAIPGLGKAQHFFDALSMSGLRVAECPAWPTGTYRCGA